MKFSNMALNLRGPWMISPAWAALMAPVLEGFLQGNIVEMEKAHQAHLVKCDSLIPAPESGANPFQDKSIYVTYLEGTLMKYDYCGSEGTRTIGQALLEADRMDDVIGHIIVTDSGGGSTDAVPEISQAISRCTKPVVALIDGMACSAAIYAISYCDKILAHYEMDIVGCIGTYMNISGYPKFRKDSGGYVRARVYADEAFEKNGGYEAALEGNFQILKETTINPMNEQFINDMKANRPNVQEEQLHGREYFAKNVIGSLIDSIGSFEDAMNAVIELAAAAQEENNSSTQQNMEQYPTLQAMPAFEGQVFDQDGSTHLQQVQLEAVEAALAEGASRQDTIDGLNQQLTEAQDTIAARDARITELEASLEAAIARAENPNPEEVQVHHEGEGEQGVKPSTTFEEALAACNDFNNKHNI